MISTPDPDDLARVKRWFERLSEHVRAVDFAGAYPLFADDMIAFGTFENFVTGRDAAERAQWRNVWPVTTEFRYRMDDIRAIVSPDRLFATGMGVFDSTGYHEDGTPYERPGRTTVALARSRVGEDWVAVHTHMSLFRDVPSRSYGRKGGMSETIPIIDIADFLAGRPRALDAVGRQVHDALTTVGFFVLTGHDVPLPLIERTFAEARRFHQLPIEKKLALKLNEHINGYMVMGRYAVRTSDINKNDKGDLNEAFFIKRERPADDPLLLSGRRFVGPNQWPDEADLPGFRTNVLEYVEVMDRFTRRFLPAVAVALDLPPGWFDDAFADSQFTFRMSHYPPVMAEPNQFGIAPHTDSNFMTFLAQTEVPGLQVRMPSNGPNGGNWLDVPFVPGSFAVNSGDMVRRWTNGRFLSTPHRAVPPVGRDRYAIPFFLGPRFDQLIECLPTCTGPDNPPRWPPITYADWQQYWYDANYDPKIQRDVA